jgi:hypothetical protein
METGTSFTAIDPDGEDRFQRLRADLGISTFGLNLLRPRPGDEGETRELGRGELARVAPDVRRRLWNRTGAPQEVELPEDAR